MKRRKIVQAPGVGAAAGVGLLLCGAVVWQATAHDPQGLFGPVAAAWVQAIGSIAAVGGAAWVAVWQAGQRETERRAENDAFIDAAHTVLDRTERICAVIRARLEPCLPADVIGFMGNYLSWVDSMQEVSADMRLLAQRAPHAATVAELIRASSVLAQSKFESVPEPKHLTVLFAQATSIPQLIPQLRSHLDAGRARARGSV
jgi:hypothetical protein